MSDDSIEELQVKDLKKALRERDLPVSGNKDELVARLEEAIAAEAEEGLQPVIRFDGLQDNQIYNHGGRQFGPGYQEEVDPDSLKDWQQSAIDAGVARIVRISQEG